MVELSALRDWLAVAPTDTGDDSLLLELEARAVAIIERQTGFSYSVADEYTEVVIGDGTPTLWLSRNPTTDPTEVLEQASIGDAGAEVTDWILRGGRLLRTAGAVWTKGYGYAVTYSAGYEVGTEPGDVAQVVLSVVSVLYNDRGDEGKRSETIGGYSYSKDAVAEIKAAIGLLPYRPVMA